MGVFILLFVCFSVHLRARHPTAYRALAGLSVYMPFSHSSVSVSEFAFFFLPYFPHSHDESLFTDPESKTEMFKTGCAKIE